MFTFNEIAALFNSGQRLNPDVTITSVEFDSRKVQAGSLFIPLKGATDGHDYLESAIDKGAVATLWGQKVAPHRLPAILVEDTLTAFQDLARFYLQKVAPKVVAITGSNGKTTTKDMTANVLSQKYLTYKTQGNFNNHIGLPYTILAMPQNTEFLVLEMGMDHPGEIDFLSRLGQPDAAAITLIGESHLKYFGQRSGIAKAKMEITHGLKKDGFLVVPGDEVLLEPLLADVSQEIFRFQMETGSPLTAHIVEQQQQKTTFTLSFLPGEFEIPVSGNFNVKNALIAAFFGKQFGVSPADIFKGLKNVVLTQNRSQWLAHDEVHILSDVYNANPTAMSLVLQSFQDFTTTGKKIAVLGDMLELGATSPALHAGITEYLQPDKIQIVYLYGPEMQALYEELLKKYPQSALHYYPQTAKADLIADLLKTVAPHDYVVLKGSNGMHLDEIVAALLKK